MKSILLLFLLLSASSFSQESKNMKKATELCIGGRYEEAIPYLEKELKKNPGNSEAWYRLGMAKSMTSRGAGFEEFNKALELNPNYCLAYNARGNTYSSEDDAEKRLSDYDNAVRCDPSEEGFVYNRATAYLALGRYQEAIDDCNKCIEMGGHTKAFAYELRAEAKSNLGDFKGALDDCNYLIELSDGGNPDAYAARAGVKEQMGDYRGAIDDYLKAMGSGMQDGYYLYKIGDLKLMMGDQTGACEMFKRAVEEGFEYADPELLKLCN